MVRFPPRDRLRRALLAAIGIVGVFLSSCTASAPDAQRRSAVKMRDFYPDLQSGRFRILADFESPEDAAFFEIVDAGEPSGSTLPPSIERFAGRSETGGAALRAVLPREAAELRLNLESESSKSLPRDWREFQLVILNVFLPTGGAPLRVSLEGADGQRWRRTLQIPTGWRVLRVDLAEVAEEVNLADVRALSLGIGGGAASREFFIDDIVLADNRRTLQATSASGELYAFVQGRRTHIGAHGCFEAGFADGVMVRCGAAGGETITPLSGLGPWPLPLPDGWNAARGAAIAYDDPALFATWGDSVASAQQVVELSPVRAVVRGVWRYAPAASEKPAEDAPQHIWRYVIYPSGHVFVTIRSEGGAVGWPAARVGYALAFDGRRIERLSPPGNSASSAHLVVQGAGAGVIWASADAALMERRRDFESADPPRVAIFAGDRPGETLFDTVHMLVIGSRMESIQAEAAAEIVAFFRDPPAPEMAVGKQRKNEVGDQNTDGYNESEGCYEFAPDGGVLRFTLGSRETPLLDAVFRVHETIGKKCWVYASGRPVRTVGRDAEERLLFTLPGRVGDRTLIEVHVR